MISVNNNMGNLRAQDALQTSHRVLQTSLERLSTGVRINRAEDDAAGITVRDRFAAQINGYDEGIRNIQTGMGMIQVAEQGLNKITDALQQMRSLAVRAADDNLTDKDRQGIQAQVKGLLLEVNQRAQNTTYNGHNLLNGSIADAHAERQGGAQVQTNSFLASGNKLVSGAETLGTNATTVNAISQGSYEVKLVFDASKRDNPVATTTTSLGGTALSGNAYLNSSGGAGSKVTASQTIYDRDGNAHDMNVTFTNVDNQHWTYQATGGAGGAWSNPVNFSGAVTFDGHGNFTTVTAGGGTTTTAVSGSKVLATIGDGSAAGQTWALDFGKLRDNDQSAAVNMPNFTANGTASLASTRITLTDGTAGAAAVAGLNANAAAGATVTTSLNGGGAALVDRTGVVHDGAGGNPGPVTMTFQKTVEQTGASNLADKWNVSFGGLTGGAWSGASTNTSNVQVEFDTSGNVAKVNGQAGTTMTINVQDGTAAGQDVVVDLSGIHSSDQHAGPAPALPTDVSTLARTSDGTAGGSPTTAITLGAGTRLSSGYGPTTIAINNIVDRTGPQSVHGASVSFTQVGDTNTWNYSVNAPSASGYTGQVSGGTGAISFDEQGNLQGPTSFSATLADGTPEGQTLNFNLTGLTLGRGSNFAGSSSNGSQGTGDQQVNAVIYFSGADDAAATNAAPIATLADVSGSAKTANLGGISFTVAKVSTMDVGLTSYVKAYTYVSAQTQDNALQFQVGPDEGMIHRVGIAKMDAQTLLRGNDATYKYQDVKLETTLQAQDLIGQVDDALNFVSAENLKVGQFQNQFTRTLDLARQQNTSITNAQSNLNDADMATEATNQSKRMILVQSGTAMVAQANTTSQFLLQLLR